MRLLRHCNEIDEQDGTHPTALPASRLSLQFGRRRPVMQPRQPPQRSNPSITLNDGLPSTSRAIWAARQDPQPCSSLPSCSAQHPGELSPAANPPQPASIAIAVLPGRDGQVTFRSAAPRLRMSAPRSYVQDPLSAISSHWLCRQTTHSYTRFAPTRDAAGIVGPCESRGRVPHQLPCE